MESPSEDKEWATKYLLDPLNAPEPYEETGPSSWTRRAPAAVRKSPTASSSKPSRATSSGYPTPPTSASPTQSTFHPSNPYSAHRSHTSGDSSIKGKSRRRGSSLTERYPGDMSHRPLDQLRKEAKAANRSPHLKKTHLPGADTIDVLDRSVWGPAYHHEGPYDATLRARNTTDKNSPVAAVKETNAEALRATAPEYIKDSLTRHMPLQGTAVIPSGMAGMNGRVMRYEEGADLMREADAPGGAYKRWPGIQYLPNDYKGKGEPSFTIEKALKDSKAEHRRYKSDGHSYEMQPPNNRSSSSHLRSTSADLREPKASGSALSYSGFESGSGMRRSNTTGSRFGEGIKRRFGSLRRSLKASDA